MQSSPCSSVAESKPSSICGYVNEKYEFISHPNGLSNVH